jgi:hypothetical protein
VGLSSEEKPDMRILTAWSWMLEHDERKQRVTVDKAIIQPLPRIAVRDVL